MPKKVASETTKTSLLIQSGDMDCLAQLGTDGTAQSVEIRRRGGSPFQLPTGDDIDNLRAIMEKVPR